MIINTCRIENRIREEPRDRINKLAKDDVLLFHRSLTPYHVLMRVP